MSFRFEPWRAPIALLAVAACDSREALPPREASSWSSAAPAPSAPAPSASAPSAPPSASASAPLPPRKQEQPAEVLAALGARKPREFGERVKGILTRFEGGADAIAMTVDLCAGKGAGAYDDELFRLLHDEKIPAAVFVSGLWGKANPGLVKALAADPLFSIENHGDHHRPCSVDGRSAFGARGSRSLGEAVAEIDDQTRWIEKLVGVRPRFYRPGTAHADDVCAEAAERMGTPIAGYTVAGDAGASLPRAEVAKLVGAAKGGSIVLVHGGKPKRATFEGVRDAIPKLRARGVRFVRLRDVL